MLEPIRIAKKMILRPRKEWTAKKKNKHSILECDPEPESKAFAHSYIQVYSRLS